MLTRRTFFQAAGLGGCLPAAAAAASEQESEIMPVRFALNTSTIRGQDLSVPEQVDLAARAGYDGIEPWIGDLRKFTAAGGQLSDLRKRISDAGLTVDSAIGFARWIVNDPQQRASGLEQARQDMELVKAIGGDWIAAPPTGATGEDDPQPSLPEIAERYRALLEAGADVGVTPQLELWGFSKTLSKLSELAFVAIGASHPDACVLPDFYHIYKGGNDFASLKLIEASRIHCFHINDYPADPPRESIADKDRVFPGDGICPLVQVIRGLIDRGFRGTFSLELFNRDYWQRDPLAVVSEGLRKSKDIVQAAVAASS